MLVACGCGKRLNVPDRLAGKRVTCPACRKVLLVRPPAAAAAGAKIQFACACGKQLASARSLAGKAVRCPGCNAELRVPAASSAVPPARPAPGGASDGEYRPPALETSIADDAEGQQTIPLDMPASGAADMKSLLQLAAEGEAAGTAGAPSRKCPGCDARLDADAQFCVECGVNLNSDRKAQPRKVAGAKSAAPGSHRAAIAAAVVGALAVGAIITWVAVRRSRPSSAEKPSVVGGTNSSPAPSSEPANAAVASSVPAPAAAPATPSPKTRRPGVEGVEDDVHAFQAQYGRLPVDLQELRDGGYDSPAPAAGQKYVYDASTGSVSLAALEQ